MDERDYSKLYDENETELVEKAFIPLYEKLKRKQFIDDTVELIDTHFTFDPRKPYLDLGTKKKAPRKYIQKELDWYLSQDLSINGHVDDVEIWKQVAAEGTGRVNSNYGWMVFSEENGNQYRKAIERLLKNPDGRQSTCIYMRPSMQTEWNDGVHAEHDFTCTYATQHFIRDGKLEYIVWQRSMDLIFGLVNDFAWHCYVYENMLNDLSISYDYRNLNLQCGKIHYNSGSSHIYERHYELLESVVKEYTGEDKQKELGV